MDDIVEDVATNKLMKPYIKRYRYWKVGVIDVMDEHGYCGTDDVRADFPLYSSNRPLYERFLKGGG